MLLVKETFLQMQIRLLHQFWKEVLTVFISKILQKAVKQA